jgi:hypothetical protein
VLLVIFHLLANSVPLPVKNVNQHIIVLNAKFPKYLVKIKNVRIIVLKVKEFFLILLKNVEIVQKIAATVLLLNPALNVRIHFS